MKDIAQFHQLTVLNELSSDHNPLLLQLGQAARKGEELPTHQSVSWPAFTDSYSRSAARVSDLTHAPMFNIYTSDIPTTTHVNLAIYADDVCIFSSSFNARVIDQRLQTALDTLQDWRSLKKEARQPGRTHLPRRHYPLATSQVLGSHVGFPRNEAALLMRLHLLQAIVLYHQNQRQEARNLLLKANNELLSLKVDEQSVLILIELGYSPAEARLGLRATSGDTNMAANYINEKRNAREESRRRAMAQRIFRKESQKLGLCVDGKQYVDPNFVKILVNMGFGKEAARIALQKTNNIISDSIQYIQENPLPGPSSSKSCEILSLIEELVPELQAAGFDHNMSKLALQKHNGDIMSAAEELLLNNGVINGEIKDEPVDGIHVINNDHDRKLKELKEDALNRLSQDISMEDDDYLDLNLQTEEMFLKQYLTLLQND
ncbi:hypothetical protein Trydic_g7734 [Trypoxylus dichotomus]